LDIWYSIRAHRVDPVVGSAGGVELSTSDWPHHSLLHGAVTSLQDLLRLLCLERDNVLILVAVNLGDVHSPVD
jgi:hypothetical protein